MDMLELFISCRWGYGHMNHGWQKGCGLCISESGVLSLLARAGVCWRQFYFLVLAVLL